MLDRADTSSGGRSSFGRLFDGVTAEGAVLGALARTLGEVEALAMEAPQRAADAEGTADAAAINALASPSQGLCIHGAQAAKLYGFVERFLTTRVDPLQPESLVMPPHRPQGVQEVSRPGNEEDRVLQIKRARKELVRRCNVLLDAFERARSVPAVPPAATPGTAGSAACADGSYLMLSVEEDFLAMAVALRSGRLLRPSSVVLTADKDAVSAAVGSLQVLSACGFLEPGVGATGGGSSTHIVLPVVLASAELYADNVASASSRLEAHMAGQPVLLCHAHTAAAVAVAQSYFPTLATCHVLVITCSSYVLSYSLVKHSGSVMAESTVECVCHGQIQFVGTSADPPSAAAALSLGGILKRGAAVDRSKVLLSAPSAIRKHFESVGLGAVLGSLDAVHFASMGATGASAFSTLRQSIENSFPSVPIITAFPGNCMYFTAPATMPCSGNQSDELGGGDSSGDGAVRALGVEDGLVAFGASLLAQKYISLRCTQPLGALIGIKSNLVWRSSPVDEAFVSVIPFFNCSSPFGSSAMRSSVALRRLMQSEGTWDRSCGDVLCFEVVEISMVGAATDPSAGSFASGMWNSGFVCVQPSITESISRDGAALFMNRNLPVGYSSRVLGRVPLDSSLVADVLSGAEVTVSIELTIPAIAACFKDRNEALSSMLVSMSLVKDQNKESGLHWLMQNTALSSLSVHPSSSVSDGPEVKRFDVLARCEVDANDCKSRGNSAMAIARPGSADVDAIGALESAILSYSSGLQLDPLSAVLYSNRCAAQLQLVALIFANYNSSAASTSKSSIKERDRLLHRALQDAALSAGLRPQWSKAHARLGEARFRLGHLQAAVDAYTRAYECELAELEPASPSTVESMKNRGVGHSSVLRSLNEAMAALDACKKQREEEEQRQNESSKRPRKDGAASDRSEGGSSCTVS